MSLHERVRIIRLHVREGVIHIAMVALISHLKKELEALMINKHH